MDYGVSGLVVEPFSRWTRERGAIPRLEFQDVLIELTHFLEVRHIDIDVIEVHIKNATWISEIMEQ